MAAMPNKLLPAARPAAFIAGVLACAIAAAGCTSGRSPGSTAPVSSPGTSTAAAGLAPAGTLNWHPCRVQGARIRCASLRVPLNYRDPAGRKITLALSEVPASAPAAQQQGDLLVNPGGPGASGLPWSVIVAERLDHNVSSEYNIIGFDPRGVGASVPALHCNPSFFAGVRPDYIPANQRAEQVLIGRARLYAADCERRYGWLLPYMTTADAARDMDAIRAALGQEQISYLGYSWGTYLGQVYATLFPHRLRKMVLDSVVDPRGVWYADNIGQDYAFEGRIRAFYAWAATHDAVYHLGSTEAQVEQAWYRARAMLKAHPIFGVSGPMVGPDEFDDTFQQGGYLNAYWPVLALALSFYLHGHATDPMISIYKALGAQNENEFAVYNAVECSDVNWPRDWAKWDADTRRVYRTAPFMAWDNAWFNAACAFWPVRGPAQPLQIRGAGLPGILMIQGTLDAATPYAGALVARRALPTARMVVVLRGGNHGQSLAQPPNTCVDGYLNRYLGTGALPSRPGLVNAVCPATPLPAAAS
jgi:pimeloyl-ACP methyl ester carboxylesterase